MEITNVKSIITAPAGIALVVLKVETDQAGLYGVGCATYTQRARLEQVCGAVAKGSNRQIVRLALIFERQRASDLSRTRIFPQAAQCFEAPGRWCVRPDGRRGRGDDGADCRALRVVSGPRCRCDRSGRHRGGGVLSVVQLLQSWRNSLREGSRIGSPPAAPRADPGLRDANPLGLNRENKSGR